MWEQNETGLEGEFGEDIGPAIFRRFGGLGNDPELAVWMMNEGDGVALSRGDGPTASQEVDLVVGIAAAAEVEGQMEVEQTGVWARAHGIALLGLGLGPGVVGREASGATNGLILPFQFLIEECLSRGIGGDPLEKKERDQTLLEGAKAAFDFPLGLGTGSDQMGDAQGGEGALELGPWIPSVGGGLVAEQSQSIGVEGQRASVSTEGGAEVFEMVPGGVGGNEGAGDVFPGMVVDGQQEGLLVLVGPPGMDG